jgi:integrase
VSNLRRIPYTKPIPAGAEVITRKGQRFARFKDRRGKAAEAPLNDDGTRIQLLSKKWYGEYRDADGIEQCVPLSTDKTAAAQMLADLVKKAELGKAGITDPYEAHRKRPLAEHVADFERGLVAKGNGATHAQAAAARVRRTVEGCRFAFIGDISISPVQEFLASLRDTGRRLPPLDPTKEWYTKAELATALRVKPHSITPLVKRWRLEARDKGKKRRYPRATAEALRERLDRGPGPATINHYVRSLRSFTRWLVRDRRTDSDPLAGLSGVNASTDVRRARRALSPAELGLVLQTVLDSPREFRSLTGRDRHFLYLTACGTGFRAGELASLRPESFSLDDSQPTATVPAAYTKNKRVAVQPLSAEVAEALRGYLADRPSDRPVWPGNWADNAAEMLQADLEACGIPYAVEGPDGPLYADFHALRHSYVALLDQAGLTLKVAMQLARHSDPKLTMARYGRAQLHDLAAAIEGLPLLLEGPHQGSRVLKATGTEGQADPESLRQACAKSDAEREPLRLVDAVSGEVKGSVGNDKPLAVQGVESDCNSVIEDERSAPCRTRTYNPLIKSQLLCQLS